MNLSILENNLEIQQKVMQVWETEYPEQGLGIPMCYVWTEMLIPLSSVKRHKPKSIKKAQTYAEQIRTGMIFPPIIVTKCDENLYELLDGYHRCWAYQNDHTFMIKAYVGQFT